MDKASLGRLHILEVQRLIRFMPKIVMAVVPGWAVGGGHSLHVICDLSIASKEHAIFKQTDPDVASFDSGYGSAYLAKQCGQKRAREVFFLGLDYSAQEAFEMGMINKVVPHEELEDKALEWAEIMNSKSPTAMRMLKSQLYEIELRKRQEARQEIEASKMKIEWGSQIRNYVMHPYKLVKDVRTAHETGNVDAVMDGDISAFLKAYLMMMGQRES